MSPLLGNNAEPQTGVPRASGDEPPTTRGGQKGVVFPARAGMSLKDEIAALENKRVPRASGDEPY